MSTIMVLGKSGATGIGEEKAQAYEKAIFNSLSPGGVSAVHVFNCRSNLHLIPKTKSLHGYAIHFAIR